MLRNWLLQPLASAMLLLSFSVGASECLRAAATLSQPEAAKVEAPQPQVLVFLERQNLRERDCVPIEIRFLNPSDQPIEAVDLTMTAPAFLSGFSDSCAGPAFPQSLGLGPVGAHSVLPRRVFLRSGETIIPGDFNLLFVFDFQWKVGSSRHQAFTSVEKSIHANLLGSENVAGVPLGLAGFIVPGLFFWLMLTAWRVPWSVGIGLGDKLVHSVVVSSLFVFLGTSARLGSWSARIDLASGISITKLIWLAVYGAGVGALVGLADFGWRRWRAAVAKSLRIDPGDTEQQVLEKLLRKNSGRRKPRTTVFLKDGKVYRGSLAESDATNAWLIGWFQIETTGAPEKAVAELKARADQPLQLLLLARRHGLAIGPRNAIREVDKGKSATTGKMLMQFKAEEISAVLPEAEKEETEAVSLA